ncbi:MAG TPA: MraY family glycosyltransferase [Phycisphaerae bacterium]|nr:MraY family glycosyltransferase [Phycisphaerae bacterium]
MLLIAQMANISPLTVIQPYMPVFYVAFVVTFLLTPMMRYFAHKYGVVDEPDGGRKIHSQPIAYLGGVATFLGWVAGVVASVIVVPSGAEQSLTATVLVPPGIILGAGAVMICGLLDDCFNLPPKFKLFGQFIGAACLFFMNVDQNGFLGARHDMADMIVAPFEHHGLIPFIQASHFYPMFASIFCAALVVFIIMSTCNALNLLDGMDGLCGGVTGIMALGYLILSVYLATGNLAYSGSTSVSSLDPARITMSLALLGAVLGFLPFNFNPANIFLGDTGSMFLGFVCGAMMVMFGNDGIFRWFLASIVIFGLPMLDTFLAIVRRKISGRPVFSPDSGHFHHFLLKRGMSVKKSALVSYALAVMFVSFALVIVIIPTTLALGIYLVLFGWLIVAAFKMGMVQFGLPLKLSTAEPSGSQASVSAAVLAPEEKRSAPVITKIEPGTYIKGSEPGLMGK